MKKLVFAIVAMMVCNYFLVSVSFGQDKNPTLKVVFIRHGEKPKKGNNLTCEGFNRSLQLPRVLYAKFGVPSNIYVPALGLGSETKHCRMFETIVPFAVKYNITLNTKFEEKDASDIATEIKKQTGTVFIVWEHKAIAPIVQALGINNPDLKWDDDDFDSIWILTYTNGTPVFTLDKEGIGPSSVCPF